jgi:hypothetical protein
MRNLESSSLLDSQGEFILIFGSKDLFPSLERWTTCIQSSQIQNLWFFSYQTSSSYCIALVEKLRQRGTDDLTAEIINLSLLQKLQVYFHNNMNIVTRKVSL